MKAFASDARRSIANFTLQYRESSNSNSDHRLC
jgi:hypothetical protein